MPVHTPKIAEGRLPEGISRRCPNRPPKAKRRNRQAVENIGSASGNHISTARRTKRYGKEEPNMNAYARLTALENAIKSRILLYSEQLFADMTEDSMFLNELYYLLGKREELFQELGCSYNQTKEEEK
jgi:hypothetical protein